MNLHDLPQLLADYERLCAELLRLLLQDGRTQRYYYEAMGISRATFTRRLREGGGGRCGSYGGWWSGSMRSGR